MYFFIKRSSQLKIVAMGLSIIGLTACNPSHPPDERNGNQLAVHQGMSGHGARTQGVNEIDYNSNQIRYDDEGRVINSRHAPSNQVLYFDYDSSAVQARDDASLNAQIKYLVNHPAAIVRLEGHTDNRGSREYNIGLGQRRATSVANRLKTQGVNSSQIKEVSYGKEKPAVEGTGEEVWRLNRRVELIYENKGNDPQDIDQ